MYLIAGNKGTYEKRFIDSALGASLAEVSFTLNCIPSMSSIADIEAIRSNLSLLRSFNVAVSSFVINAADFSSW